MGTRTRSEWYWTKRYLNKNFKIVRYNKKKKGIVLRSIGRVIEARDIKKTHAGFVAVVVRVALVVIIDTVDGNLFAQTIFSHVKALGDEWSIGVEPGEATAAIAWANVLEEVLFAEKLRFQCRFDAIIKHGLV